MSEYKPQDYVNYRIESAIETIREVQTHIHNKYWNTAINRMYYACFYAVSALLVKHGIEASSHSGVRQKFGEHFVKTGKIERALAKLFTDLSEKRHKGDYNDFYDYEEDTVLRLYPSAQEFIEKIKSMLTE